MSLSDISTADLIQELRCRSDFRVSLDVFTRKSEWASDIKILVDGIPQYHQHMHGVSDLPDLTDDHWCMVQGTCMTPSQREQLKRGNYA